MVDLLSTYAIVWTLAQGGQLIRTWALSETILIRIVTNCYTYPLDYYATSCILLILNLR